MPVHFGINEAHHGGQTLNRSNELNVALVSTQLQDNAQLKIFSIFIIIAEL